jgi:integrase/recombinase XerD
MIVFLDVTQVTERKCIMAIAVASAEMAPAAVLERFRQWSLTVRGVSAEKVSRRVVYLGLLFGFLGPPPTAAGLFASLTPRTITAFLIDYAPRHGPGSRRDMHAAARAFLRFAYAEQFLAQDLSALVPTVRDRAPTQLPRALPESCLAALEKSIERRSAEGRRDAAIVCLLSTYGVRGAQVRRLRLEHLDWERERIHFCACKGGRPIEQHLTAKAGNRLADYIANGRPRSSSREVFLAQSTATALAHPRELSRIVDRRLRQAGVPVPAKVSRGTHGFRHAFATRLVGRVPFKDLTDMLGHRSPSSTLAYGRVDVQTLQQAALPWPGGPA